MTLRPLIKTLITAGAVFAAGFAAAQVTVTTGAGYVKMVNALTAAYEAQGGETVQKAFGGNIGQRLAQVRSGNGVNIVISDDKTLQRFNDTLAEKTVALGDTPLVMVWRHGIDLKAPTDITDPSVKSVVYPDPKAAIYGRAAHAWLKQTGLDKKVADKTNRVSNVMQVYSYVATGNMDVGFVNLLVWRKSPDKVAGHFEITDHGADIHMVARPVKGAQNDADVTAFLDYLQTPTAKKIMAKFGVR